jgi:D-alanyl-D-alanine carboxypeptidase (penicillin-binding protein 5/6)
MAVIARAALANEEIRRIVGTKTYTFTGPEGAAHKLTNHNKMLSSYAGAIGMKTGYTTKARSTFVGAATRDGRTMLAIVFGADNPYSYAIRLLDQGFTTPVAAEPTTNALAQPSSAAAATPKAAVDVADDPSLSHRASTWFAIAFVLFVTALIVAKRSIGAPQRRLQAPRSESPTFPGVLD